MLNKVIPFFFLAIFIADTYQGVIQQLPDKPLVITSSYMNQIGSVGTKFEFRFLVAKEYDMNQRIVFNAHGALYDEYIGVKFNDLTGASFDFNSTPLKHSCALKNVDTGKSIGINAEFPSLHFLSGASIETDVAYCRLTNANQSLNLIPGHNYLLTLVINNAITISNSFGSFTLFTSSTNNVGKTIFDLGAFPNVYIPSPYISSSSKIIFALTTGPNISTETDEEVPIDITVEFNDLYSWKDHLVCIRFPTKYISPNPETQLVVDNLPGFTLPLPNLPFTTINMPSSDPQYTILGFALDEDFYSLNRNTFKLMIKKLSALGLVTDTESIEIYIQYRNDQNMIAYSKFPLNITSSQITFTAKHPYTTPTDTYDIFKGGAWPITFTIRTTKQINGKYFLIKQTNAKPQSRVTFIASSCDFSNFGIVETGFAYLPKCYPLDYSNNPNDNLSSGVFFYHKGALLPSQDYPITIWVFFDECGLEGTVNLFDDSQSKADILFGVYIYDDIDKTQYASQRIKSEYLFKDKTESNAITCYNTYMGNPDTGNYLFDINDYQRSTTENAAITALTNERLMYKEYFDWDIYSFQGNYETNPLLINLFDASVDPKYIYSKTAANQITENDHILFKVNDQLEFSSELKKLGQFYPMGFAVDLNNKLVAIKGRFFMKMSPEWIKKSSNAQCYAGWVFGSPQSTSSLNWVPKMTEFPQKFNWITNSDSIISDTTVIYKPLIDTITEYTLKSSVNEGWNYDTLGYYTRAEWGFGSDVLINQNIPPSSPMKTSFGFSDNCHQWNNLKQKITSPYTPIEVILGIQWEGISGFSSRYIRVMRMIKLFPEGGVFNEKSSSTIFLTQANIITNHFAYMNEDNKSGVCLFEIMPGILDGRFSANSFLLWMFLGSLIESDYENVSSSYPIGNLHSKASAYAFPSQHGLNLNNFYSSVSSVTKSDISSPILTIANLYNSYQQNGLSSYLFYLGSLLNIHLASTPSTFYANGANSLLVPYYCPFYYSNGINKPFSLGVFPSFVGAFINTNSISDYGTIGIEGFIGKNTKGTNNVFVLLSNQKSISSNPPISVDPIFNILRFSTRTASPLTLSVWNASPNGPNEDNGDNCSGFVWLFTDIVTFNTVEPTPNTPSLKYYGATKNKIFYSYGKRFTQAFFASNDILIPITPTGLDDPPYMKINTRFRIDEQLSKCELDKHLFCPYDNVAYWCLSSNFDMNNFATNYVKSQNKLFISYSQTITSTTPTIQLNEPLYDTNDHGFSIKIRYVSPIPNPPLKSQILLSIENSPNAACVIANTVPNQSSYPCVTNDVTGLNICEINETLTEYNIYCYKLDIANFPNRKVVIKNLSLHFPNNDVAWDDYSQPQVSQLSSPISFTVPTTTKITTPLPITQYIMNHTYSSKGIGKIYFKIQLGRPVHPSMHIIIDASMAHLAITNVMAYCSVSFTEPGTNEDYSQEGEKSIEGCKVDLTSPTETIQIYFKEAMYFPTKPMRDTVFIKLWPVMIDNIITRYTLTVKIDSTVLIPATQFNFNPIVPSPTLDPVSSNSFRATLSFVSKVSSQIIGDKSDYTFDFDFETAAIVNEIGTNKINEISLFLPHLLGDTQLDNLICYENTVKVNCIYSDEGLINIKYANPIVLGRRKNLIISTFTNTYSTSDIHFAITYNYLEDNTRINIIAGNGLISNKLFTPVEYGPLRFLSVITPNSSLLPREKSVYTFRFSFDYSNNQIPSATVLPAQTKIFIEFPFEYSLFANSIPTVKMKEYFSDGTSVPTSTTSILINEIEIRQNRLILTTNDITPSQANFRYWDLSIDPIFNPRNSPINEYTNFFKITCITPTNHYYSTSINRMTYANGRIDSNVNDPLYQWHIGNKITMDTSDKYLLDIVYNDSKNVFILQPGRYFKAYIAINSNRRAKPAVTDVSIVNDVFKTQYTSYTVSSLFGEPYEFYIGASCSSNEGTYIVTPTLSNKDNFMDPPQVIITLQLTIKGKISLDTSSYTIPFDSQLRVPLYFSEPNFDSLLIKWNKAATTDSVTILNNIDVKPFAITDQSRKLTTVFTTCVITDPAKTIVAPQIFEPIPPNKCYEFNSNQLSIKQLSTLTIPSLSSDSLILKDHIKVFNRDDDESLEVNEVKLEFTYPESPMYLYCGIVCKFQSHTIKDKYGFNSYPQFIANRFIYNSMRSYYFGYYETANTQKSMHFKNLVKGYEYKLSCYVASTESNFKFRSDLYSTAEVDQLMIKPADEYSSQCVTYYFNGNLNSDQKQTYIDYCQSKFSEEGGYFSNGCIKCTDQIGVIQPTGFKNDDSFFDCKTETCLNQIDLADITKQLTSFEQNREFTICATSSRVCSSVPTPSININTIFPQFISDTKDTHSINTNLGITDIELNNKRPYHNYQEKIIQESSIVVKLNSNMTSIGSQIEFEASSLDGIMNCYWKVQLESEVPDKELLLFCLSTKPNCGIIQIRDTKIYITIHSLKEYAAVNKKYSIYMTCTRPVPSPKYLTMILIGKFTLTSVSSFAAFNYYFISLSLFILFS